MYFVFGVLGFLGALGASLGYLMSRAAVQSSCQREHLRRLWATLAVAFMVFVAPVMLACFAGPKPNAHPVLWTAMSCWMGLTYPVTFAALVFWVLRWWRNLAPRESDSGEPEKDSRKRLVKWVALGAAVPALLLVFCLYALFFEVNWRVQQIPATTVERIVNESKGAEFQVFQGKDGRKRLWVTLPGRHHMRFDAPADEGTLALLARHGLKCKTIVEGEDRSLDALGGPAKVLVFISAFCMAPPGLTLLVLLRRKPKELTLPHHVARPRSSEPARSDQMLVTMRRDRAPWKAFALTSACVFLLVFCAGVIFASWANNQMWHSSTVRIKLDGAAPTVVQQQVGVIRSDALLGLVVKQLCVDREWVRQFNRGRWQAPAGTPNMLRQRMNVWADTNNCEISIMLYAPDGPATIKAANAIAKAYCAQRDASPPAEIIAKAPSPATRLGPPNVRLILTIVGAILAMVLALVIGTGAAILRAWIRSRSASALRAMPTRAPAAAFTLIELLVVIGIIGILASLLLPALSRGTQKAQGVSCLNNGRQMMTAMTLYTTDNHDFFPPNPDDGNKVPGHNWAGGQAGDGGPDEFNPDVLKDPNRSLLSPYLSGNVSVFHCPGDRRKGYYQGSDPSLLGRMVLAARTFSMSQAVGTICLGFDQHGSSRNPDVHEGAPTMSVNGPWLNSQDTHQRNSPWYTYGKLSSIGPPGPAMLWVLVDEDERGLNDAAFAFGMEQPMWLDAPGTYHSGGCGFAFADGHSESHTWLSKSPKQGQRSSVINTADHNDWLWMRARTSADSTGSMPPPP
jgi:prepilin-type N-terminal cleavage/methylation domain-containing protein/prepilin-type processing-associated H-X9-DG protein